MRPSLRLLLPLALAALPASPIPLGAQAKRALTFDDFIALKVVADPQPSPDGRHVAYTVTEYSLAENRGITRIWLVETATGRTRPFTGGPGSDRQPRWSPDGKQLAFVSTRE
ncbi:MAG TPA: hypothetical protein VNI61_08795, partial [Gemmatimonadales bacterium]|nr:hypothetical protein [Gemmatimonadales bacterium]